MNPQEKELLTGFLQQLTTAQAGQKDREAEGLIGDAISRQPDAAYLLVQRALQLDQAFQATQAHATKLQGELDQLRTGASGGGSGFLNDAYAWGSRPAAPAAPVSPVARVSVSGRALQSQAASGVPAAHAAPAAPVTRPSPWGGNLLGTMAATAGGVVAGSFLFQGIQNMMDRNDPGAAAGAGQKHASGQQPPAEDAPHTAGPLEPDDPGSWASNEDGGDSYASGDDVSGGDFA